MKLDELKVGWKTEIEQNNEKMGLTAVIESLKEETVKMDKSVKRRDFLEISIAALLIPAWSWKLFYSASVIQTVGLWIAILACIYIPYKLIKAKQVETAIDDSVLTHLKIEKSKIEKQKKLLETVALWYISPLMIAIILITAGGVVDESGLPIISEDLIIYYGFCALLVIGTYLLNKRAAKTKFSPLLDKVNQRIDELNHLNTLSE